MVLIAAPVLQPVSWWSPVMAAKPHLTSLADFVRDVATVRVLDLERHPAGAATDMATRLADELTGDVALVAISCWSSMHYGGAVEVAKHVRRLSPEVPIVVGGHHPTAVPDDFRMQAEDGRSLFDTVVRGDGEHVLRDLCTAWPRRSDTTSVICGPAVQLLTDHIDWPRYPWTDPARRVLWLTLSRGCPFQCAFCVEPSTGRRFSAYSVDRALAIVDGLAASHAPRVLCFTDPLFGANKRWTEAFLRGLVSRQLPMMFWAQTRPDLMTPTLLELAQASGFKLDFGLDTASEHMVRLMRKSANPGEYLKKSRVTLQQAHAIGLHHDVFLLFNYPGETPETVAETQTWIESLIPDDQPASGWISSQTFFLLPGTEVYDQQRELEARFGTRFAHPTWWRQEGDLHALATRAIPSASWQGRDNELWDFFGWQQRINARWSSHYPETVFRFRTAFFGAP